METLVEPLKLQRKVLFIITKYQFTKRFKLLCKELFHRVARSTELVFYWIF